MVKRVLILVFLGVALTSCGVFKCNKEDSTAKNGVSKLEGNWELNYITGPRIAFDGLYPNKKPAINFDIKENHVSGNNGCNSFSGKLNVDGNKINFTDQAMAMTKMACMDGQGEQVFMSTLQKITTYAISDDGKTLTFISDDIAMMRFVRK
ncbi:META domain-containing protein [Flavobacterium sp. GA093]|uniref:META domain-containing protein n=1 Tax=Flavobacterium hydrocarbonoxydans TaxID=2683249 RepID=A0A6I4NP54_9FLAO|nr:META domain-containing protein [Flavobacterium hydrocarbonoxydans]MWB96148.1 META domain-containing protein [Flavobacterium hydrocarbonoxydans]